MAFRQLALAVTVLFVSIEVVPGAESARSAKELFGSFAAEAQSRKAPMTADLDGDGKPDEIYIVTLLAQKPNDRVENNITFVNPWRGKPPNPKGGTVAIGVRLASGARYVFHDDDFFSSPIWKDKNPPVAIAKRGSSEHRNFARQASTLRHDIIVLGTEAGIDIALYWGGKRFVLLQPKEVP